MPISGYKMATPAFKNISTENYPIDNFVVKGATDGKTTIQVLNEKGSNAGTYYWFNELTDETGTYPAGWFDFTGLDPAGIELKPGEAVFFNTTEDNVTVQSAGEVGASEITCGISGFKMFGNGTPVKIDIDKVTVQGATDGKTTIQVLNEKGSNAGTYYWFNELTDETGTYPAGWFDFTGLDPAGIELEAGEAVFFNTTETGVTVKIPSALTK